MSILLVDVLFVRPADFGIVDRERLTKIPGGLSAEAPDPVNHGLDRLIGPRSLTD